MVVADLRLSLTLTLTAYSMDMIGMRMGHWALGSSTITGSLHQPPVAISRLTAFGFDRAVRSCVRRDR